jgi:phosphoribosyl 1,2-cyclic phosphodiesterase
VRLISLQSGSNGNCLYVEAGAVCLLFDAGISGKRAQERLAEHGRDIRQVDALILSHDHGDHTRSAGIFQRKFGLPLCATEPTLAAAGETYRLGELSDVRCFRSGQELRFGSVTVSTIPTPHDGVDGVAFVIDDGHQRLGILTDLGHVFKELPEVIASLDAVLLESNYDCDMLEDGPYPAFLKQRIRGNGGHLSNVEAAELVAGASNGRLRWACLGHLSQDNNNPAVAMGTWESVLGSRVPIHLASRYGVSDVLEV